MIVLIHVLEAEFNEFIQELHNFIDGTHNNSFNKDKMQLLINKYKDYEAAKDDYTTGIVQAVEKRVSDVNKNLEAKIRDTHESCTYRNMAGKDYFGKADNYVKERLKVASLVIGLVVILATYNLGQIGTKLDSIDKGLAQFRLEQAKVIAELQLQAKINAQGIAELKGKVK